MKIVTIFFLMILTLLFSYCSDRKEEKEVIVQNMAKIISKAMIESRTDHFIVDMIHSDKATIKLWDLPVESSTSSSFSHLLRMDSITQPKRLKDLVDLFKSDQDNGSYVRDGGYCCCPFTHYTITFYKDSSEISVYGVDTSEAEVLFFDYSYQSSHFIKRTAWNSFLLTQ